ncbi:hypothetical protein DPMN_074779 [Dreissena polymorpha]|uniref:Uncharacterized protein n=1 Tax=Dreissena polymorpha TaxID=45954 RepID=A0A9D3YFL9_DREPO|nr:hypothetical protein DPMN_074779 [Dreissena polymorpha]
MYLEYVGYLGECKLQWDGILHMISGDAAPSCAVVSDWVLWHRVQVTQYPTLTVHYAAAT